LTANQNLNNITIEYKKLKTRFLEIALTDDKID